MWLHDSMAAQRNNTADIEENSATAEKMESAGSSPQCGMKSELQCSWKTHSSNTTAVGLEVISTAKEERTLFEKVCASNELDSPVKNDLVTENIYANEDYSNEENCTNKNDNSDDENKTAEEKSTEDILSPVNEQYTDHIISRVNDKCRGDTNNIEKSTEGSIDSLSTYESPDKGEPCANEHDLSNEIESAGERCSVDENDSSDKESLMDEENENCPIDDNPSTTSYYTSDDDYPEDGCNNDNYSTDEENLVEKSSSSIVNDFTEEINTREEDDVPDSIGNGQVIVEIPEDAANYLVKDPSLLENDSAVPRASYNDSEMLPCPDQEETCVNGHNLSTETESAGERCSVDENDSSDKDSLDEKNENCPVDDNPSTTSYSTSDDDYSENECNNDNCSTDEENIVEKSSSSIVDDFTEEINTREEDDVPDSIRNRQVIIENPDDAPNCLVKDQSLLENAIAVPRASYNEVELPLYSEKITDITRKNVFYSNLTPTTTANETTTDDSSTSADSIQIEQRYANEVAEALDEDVLISFSANENNDANPQIDSQAVCPCDEAVGDKQVS